LARRNAEVPIPAPTERARRLSRPRPRSALRVHARLSATALTPLANRRPWLRHVAWPGPAGWVAGLFCLYAALRMALAGHADLRVLQKPWRAEIFAAGLLVVTVKLVRDFRGHPWPAQRAGAAHWHRLGFGLALAPAMLWVAIHARALSADVWESLASDRPSVVLIVASVSILRDLLLTGLPTLMVWLWLGAHLKTNASLRPARFARESSARLVDLCRDWLPPAVLIGGYVFMAALLEGPDIHDRDAGLAALDRALFGGINPVAALQHIVWPPLSEWLAFSYCFFIVLYPLCFGAVFASSSRRGFRELAFAVTLALAVGNICYTLVPAQGPRYAEHFPTQVVLSAMRDIQEQLMDRARIPRDCFPSLHTAVSLIMGWALYRHARRVFWWVSPVIASIPLACVYFRYHYVADVLAGAALAVAIMAVTPRVISWADRVRSGGVLLA
jgi:hypothetical protein